MPFYPLLATLLVSAVSLLGILTIRFPFFQKNLRFFVALSAGTLLANVFFHLLPEAVEEGGGFTPEIAFTLVGAILFSFLVESVLHWQHCHHGGEPEHKHAVGKMNLYGDLMHNFLDGIVIAAAFSVDVRVGIATTVAVILHEIPQEFSDYMVLIYAGYSKKKALFFNFTTALASVLGAVLTLIFLDSLEWLHPYLLAFAAGSLLYIAMADLIPEIHNKHEPRFDPRGFLALLLGILLIGGLTLLEGGH